MQTGIASNVLLCRRWLPAIAEEYAKAMGIAPGEALTKAAEDAAQIAITLLKKAPWHLRLMVVCVEINASLFCFTTRLYIGNDPQTEMKLFTKFPIISAPLLRLYRSLTAIGWFEQPLALQAFGISETAEQRQTRFRGIRENAA